MTQRRYFHPATSPDLVFVRGMEVTTAYGHANVYGVDGWVDFRMTRPSDAHALAARGACARAASSRSTTTSRRSPGTTSCPRPTAWRSGSPPGRSGTGSRSPAGRTASPRACACPRSAAATSTSPTGSLPEGPLTLGRPTTVLDLPELSEDAVLAAMKAGRGYVTEAPDGPHLSLTAGDAPHGRRRPARPARRRGAGPGRRRRHPRLDRRLGPGPRRADPRRRLARRASPAPRSASSAPRSSPRRAAKPSSRGFRAAVGDRPLPEGLTEADLAAHPVRRALSNPIYVEA